LPSHSGTEEYFTILKHYVCCIDWYTGITVSKGVAASVFMSILLEYAEDRRSSPLLKLRQLPTSLQRVYMDPNIKQGMLFLITNYVQH